MEFSGLSVFENHLVGDAELDFISVLQIFNKGEEQFQNVGLLEVGGLGVRMGVVDFTVERRTIRTDELDIEEGEVFGGLRGMPLHLAEIIGALTTR